MRSKDAHRMTNTVNLDQEQSVSDLQCLPRSVCPKVYDSSQYDETNMRAHGIYAEPQLYIQQNQRTVLTLNFDPIKINTYGH